MTVREKQTEWLADNIQKWMQSPNQQVVIMGKTFKPHTNIVVGSPSILLWNILKERNIDAVFYDPETDQILPEKKPSVYFIGTNWPQFRTFDYASGSTIVDPWGLLKNAPSADVKLISLGRRGK
jgi:UDP-glucose 6-dehydrogenase